MSGKNLKNYFKDSVKEYYHSIGLYNSLIYTKNSINENLTTEEKVSNLLKKIKKFSNKCKNKKYNSDIMILGDMPSQEDIKNNTLFSDESGKLLTKMLKAISININEVYLSNVLHFNLAKEDEKNIKKYESLLKKITQEHIAIINPKIIFLLGSFPMQILFGKEHTISQKRGQWIPYVFAAKSIETISSFHPSFLIKQPSQKKNSWLDLQLLQKKIEEIKSLDNA
jgi:uracil-DNA glycosylase family 4